MKFSDIAKGGRAVKQVHFRLGNAPVPEQLEVTSGIPRDEYTVAVGLKAFTGAEVARVYEFARRDAKSAGVEQWLDTDPTCRLYEMAHTVALACVDPDSGDRCEPFFSSVEEVLNSPALGSDNIAYLHEQHGIWQDQCSLKTDNLTLEQVIGVIYAEAERPENVPSPLARMRPAMRETFLRTTASLFVISQKDRLLSTATTNSNSQSGEKSSVKSRSRSRRVKK